MKKFLAGFATWAFIVFVPAHISFAMSYAPQPSYQLHWCGGYYSYGSCQQVYYYDYYYPATSYYYSYYDTYSYYNPYQYYYYPSYYGYNYNGNYNYNNNGYY